ncbi:MAG: PD-(D/E)XK nuclease-like domain-containing protein [Patescibacteria group bacterium]|nr:PD-(D/E)XK nuclease-like domain-containing protein [Patescibacteria group bacterium]
MALAEPGLYQMSDDEYQSDPCEAISLRSSIAWKLVEPRSTPAHAWWACERLNPNFAREEKNYFDIGKAAHAMLFGKGAGITIIGADDYKGKKARAARERAYAAKEIPLLVAEHAKVSAMVEAARRQIGEMVDAGTLSQNPFETEHTETVAVAVVDGVLCRCMMDSWIFADDVITEYKTEGQSAHIDVWQWRARKLGYIFRLAFYRKILETLGVAFSPRIEVFVQEKEPPYLLAFYRIEDELIARADEQVRKALKIWRKCLASNHWPGYPVEGFDLGLTEKEMQQEFVAPQPGGPVHVMSEDIEYGPVKYID